jgi:hypothetical protein
MDQEHIADVRARLDLLDHLARIAEDLELPEDAAAKRRAHAAIGTAARAASGGGWCYAATDAVTAVVGAAHEAGDAALADNASTELDRLRDT